MKTILITGATSGIGEACVTEFLQAGYQVIAHGRNQEKLSELTHRENSKSLQTICFDLENVSEMEHKLESIGPVHILLNNAGVFQRKSWLESSTDDFDFLFNINVRSVYFLTRKIIEKMQSFDLEGLVLNNSSTLGTKPAPETSLYSASKAALNSLTQCLAAEFAPKIRANCILPGVVDTPIHSKNMGEKAAQAFYEDIGSIHPLGRVGTSRELARLFLYLASEDLKWMTGSLITMDGGISLVT